MRRLRIPRGLRPLVGLVLLTVLGACSRSAVPGPEAPPTLRARALIDSGNASYRREQFQDAAKRYASATLADPSDPAAYFGLGMALSKLGRDDDARRAYARARELARTPGGYADTTHH